MTDRAPDKATEDLAKSYGVVEIHHRAGAKVDPKTIADDLKRIAPRLGRKIRSAPRKAGADPKESAEQ